MKNQIERIIELHSSYHEASDFASDLRNPTTGMHAEPVKHMFGKVQCWNVKLVINLCPELDNDTYNETGIL